LTMEDSANQLIWQPNASTGSPNTLLGMKLFVSEHASELGVKGDLILTNLSQYIVCIRTSLIFQSSDSVHWSQQRTAFRALWRLGMTPMWASAITPPNGGPDLSWAAVLV
jgi:HK97 family phage major capsid protein